MSALELDEELAVLVELLHELHRIGERRLPELGDVVVVDADALDRPRRIVLDGLGARAPLAVESNV